MMSLIILALLNFQQYHGRHSFYDKIALLNSTKKYSGFLSDHSPEISQKKLKNDFKIPKIWYFSTMVLKYLGKIS